MILSANRSEICVYSHDWINMTEYPQDVYHAFLVSWDFSDTAGIVQIKNYSYFYRISLLLIFAFVATRRIPESR